MMNKSEFEKRIKFISLVSMEILNATIEKVLSGGAIDRTSELASKYDRMIDSLYEDLRPISSLIKGWNEDGEDGK